MRRGLGSKALLWLTFVSTCACGGSTNSHAPGGSGGKPATGGGASGGTNSAGANSAGSDAGGKNEGGTNEGGSGGHAGAAGGGGKVPDPQGGEPNSPLACTAPYAGPTGGPRVDGPVDLGACSSIKDEVVLARYKDALAKVPQGLYYEPSESIVFWNEPCSHSIEETVARGPTDGMGTFVMSYANDWFYEAEYCFEGGLRRVERNLRCDFFDGTRLAEPSDQGLAFLASLLWWGNYNNVGGAAILGHSVTVGDATDVVELCTITATQGDFGLCDEVRLESTRHRLTYDGKVTLGTPEVLRTLQGDCH